MKQAAVARDARATGGRRSDQGGDCRGGPQACRGRRGLLGDRRHGDAYRDRRRELDELDAAIGAPRPGQLGAVVCVGGRPVAADVFDRPGTPAGLWPRLTRGYAVDSLGAPSLEVELAGLERFLARVRDTEATSHEAVGLGTDVVLTADGFVATALVWDETVVHLKAPVQAGGRGRPGRIASPRQRARSWFRGP